MSVPSPILFSKNCPPYATCFSSYLEDENIFYKKENIEIKVDDFELVMFRSDPPVDNDYINATYILDFAKKPKIVNSTSAIRNFNEKLHATLFAEYMPKHIVTASKHIITEFLDECNEIILKPLDKCFGNGVMYLRKGDLNTRSIINTMTNNENSQVMVQKYIPAVKYGVYPINIFSLLPPEVPVFPAVLTLFFNVIDFAVPISHTLISI